MTQKTAKAALAPQTSKYATRVVVAEDEVLIRLDLVEMLTEEGYDVVGEAGDGEAAVALTTELRPDLVVMDVKMPKLDGISAAEQIASRPDRPGGDADRVQPAGAGGPGPPGRRDGVRGQAVRQGRPDPRHRDRPSPVRRDRRPSRPRSRT